MGRGGVNWTDAELAYHESRRAIEAPATIEEISTQSEALIEAECTKLLAEDGWRSLRTDPVSDKVRGKGFGEIGMADHLYIRYDNPFKGGRAKAFAEVLWVEFKRGKEKAGSHQVAWHAKERARGALTWIANEDFPATVDGFRSHYEKSGLMRREKWWI